MNSTNVKDRIEDYLNRIGIADYGFTSSEPFIGYANFLLNSHINPNDEHVTYFDIGYNKRIEDAGFYDPSMHLENAKSIISIILPYAMDSQEDRVKLRIVKESKLNHESEYKLSKASIFKDYHLLVKDYLIQIENFIQDELGGKAVGFCDTGPLNDKAVLLRTGKFKVLNNSLIWHPKFGSRFFIGYLITDLNLSDKGDLSPSDHQELEHEFCSKCGKCSKVCPNDAIQDHGHLTSKRCISYLTQSKKWISGELAAEGLTLAGYVYGCDLCQLVCPLNKQDIGDEYAYETVVDEYVDQDCIKDLTNREFRKIYNKSSSGWIGKKRFLRNIEENMTNIWKDGK